MIPYPRSEESLLELTLLEEGEAPALRSRTPINFVEISAWSNSWVSSLGIALESPHFKLGVS